MVWQNVCEVKKLTHDSRFSSIIAIQSQTNLILIEEKVYYFPKTNSSQQIPSWVIYDQLLQSYISMKLKSMSFF